MVRLWKGQKRMVLIGLIIIKSKLIRIGGLVARTSRSSEIPRQGLTGASLLFLLIYLIHNWDHYMICFE